MKQEVILDKNQGPFGVRGRKEAMLILWMDSEFLRARRGHELEGRHRNLTQIKQW